MVLVLVAVVHTAIVGVRIERIGGRRGVFVSAEDTLIGIAVRLCDPHLGAVEQPILIRVGVHRVDEAVTIGVHVPVRLVAVDHAVIVRVCVVGVGTLFVLEPVGETVTVGVHLEAVHDAVVVLIWEVLVDFTVAVVVDVVAPLVGAVVNFRVQGLAVRLVRIAVAVVVVVYAIGDAVAVGVVEAFVDLPVAVVVHTVALFGGVVVDIRIERLAVCCIGIAVAVAVVFEAIGNAIAVAVREPFVDLAVTVVIDAVAGLFRVVMDVGIEGLAIRDVEVPIVVVVVVHAVENAVIVRVVEPLVHLVVTVVVVAVALLGHAGVDGFVGGLAIGLVRIAIVVAVGIAIVGDAVAVGVHGVGGEVVVTGFVGVVESVAIGVGVERIDDVVVIGVHRITAVGLLEVADAVVVGIGVERVGSELTGLEPVGEAVMIGVEAAIDGREGEASAQGGIDPGVGVEVGGVALAERIGRGKGAPGSCIARSALTVRGWVEAGVLGVESVLGRNGGADITVGHGDVVVLDPRVVPDHAERTASQVLVHLEDAHARIARLDVATHVVELADVQSDAAVILAVGNGIAIDVRAVPLDLIGSDD